MPDYRRAWHPGGTCFFTVGLLQRQGNDLLTRHIELLRSVVKSVRQRHPFTIHGWVVLPEHLHCVIELPQGDADYATRWRLIKMGFSKALPRTERLSAVHIRRGERGLRIGRVAMWMRWGMPSRLHLKKWCQHPAQCPLVIAPYATDTILK